jgi:GTP-binding protein
MRIVTSEFVTSSANVDNCPDPKLAEFAFIGRSNVGKSSLINMLCQNSKLAKTSGTPGKTQLINHFIINKESGPWFLVDLPGYGFAKAPKKEQAKWMNFTRYYLRNRLNLMCTMVLLDGRHSPQKRDLEFMEWLGTNEVPFVMVFTKLDKLNQKEKAQYIEIYEKEMLKTWETMPETFHTSASTATGKEELLNFIGETIKLFNQY